MSPPVKISFFGRRSQYSLLYFHQMAVLPLLYIWWWWIFISWMEQWQSGYSRVDLVLKPNRRQCNNIIMTNVDLEHNLNRSYKQNNKIALLYIELRGYQKLLNMANSGGWHQQASVRLLNWQKLCVPQNCMEIIFQTRKRNRDMAFLLRS